MLYFNDCPRLVQQMIQAAQKDVVVVQDSCLQGGATLTSLWGKGNDMLMKFATAQALIPVKSKPTLNNNDNSVNPKQPKQYDIGAPTVEELLKSQARDFVVLNDYTQAPSRSQTCQESKDILRQQ
jgi:hypothetical protein